MRREALVIAYLRIARLARGVWCARASLLMPQ
jgi:hypothetical protein